MKRSCKGCKALSETGIIGYKCELGYKTDSFMKPLEECPKPRTYAQYIKEIENNQLFKEIK